MSTVVDVLVALGSLFAVVVFGSVLPVLPTGVAVSATAVLGAHHSPLVLAAVLVVGAAAAYLGDVVTYLVCRAGGDALVRRSVLAGNPVRLGARARVAERMRERLRVRPVPTLLVSRLIPGGRIPVLLAAAMVGVPLRRFLGANVPACVLWSTTYAAIGLAGRAVFPQPWQGVLAVVAAVLVGTQAAALIRRRYEARAETSSRSPSASSQPTS